MTRDNILRMIRPPQKLVFNPFDGKLYEVGHIFKNPFAEIRKNHGLETLKNQSDE
jgi:hypothetical protein